MIFLSVFGFHMRVKNAKFLIYPEYFEQFLNFRSDYKYLAIFHDKDTSQPHYHFLIMFPSQIEISVICSRSGIPDRFIRNCPDCDIFKRYLIHLDSPDKHQYSPSEVFGSISYDVTLDVSLSQVLDIIYHIPGYPSYRKVLDVFIQNKQVHLLKSNFYIIAPLLQELQSDYRLKHKYWGEEV